MRHLHKADKPDDPFSRTPLTPDMLLPNPELRKCIITCGSVSAYGSVSVMVSVLVLVSVYVCTCVST